MKAFIMTSMFLLSALLVVNLVGWMWPFLTHTITITVLLTFVFLLFMKLFFRDAR